MKKTGIKSFYRRNLPHYQPEHSIFFVTFRLTGSLPSSVISRLKEAYAKDIKILDKITDIKKRKEKIYLAQKRYFGKFDNLLDGSDQGPVWLKDDEIASIVYNAILFYDADKYDVYCFCIMPNHVHMLFFMAGVDKSITEVKNSYYIVTNSLQSLKKYTAGKANKVLTKTGEFWQHESYDHVVRNKRELENIYNYILQNPVKAGLVNNWRDWKWTYSKFE